MVTCEPLQTYRIALKTCEQSVIEHNLVTIYLNLEWSENRNENPNLFVHIFDKKNSQKPCKNESDTNFLSSNSSIFNVNYQHTTSLIDRTYSTTSNPSFYSQTSLHTDQTPNVLQINDHNDVSSTTNTNLVLNNIKTQQLVNLSPKSVKQTSIFEQRRLSNSQSPQCSSSNQSFHSSISNSSPIDSLNHLKPNGNISSISTQPALTNRIDFSSATPTIPSYPSLSSNLSTSSTFKAIACSCLKGSLVHETSCPMWSINKQTIISTPAIVQHCHNHRSLAQRAAVASQIRSNRNISMTSVKEQGLTSGTFLSMPLLNEKPADFNRNHQLTIKTEPGLNDTPKRKETFRRQRSVAGNNNSRVRKRTILKQVSLPTGITHETLNVSNDFSAKLFGNQDEPRTSPTNHFIKSPNKILSPFPLNSLQRTISNADIDQTIDDVIHGKGTINLEEQPIPITNQPSSQLVWVQSGAVTTKTWLSPLYQKQNVTTNYESSSATLTHQDVVNIAQQVVCPAETEQTLLTTVVLPPSITTSNNNNNNKRRNRSKSTSNTQNKRNRQVKTAQLTRPHSNSTTTTTITTARTSTIEEKLDNIEDHTDNTSSITPTLNLIGKPIIMNTNVSSVDSVEKNDLWQGQHPENVDLMLDGFEFVSIDEDRNSMNNNFDFDLNIDRFSSMTPPAPVSLDHQRYSQASVDKYSHCFTGGDTDVYEHFLNPMPISSSSSIWQENQVTSSVSTPPDFQVSPFSAQPVPSQTLNQQYYSSRTEENHDHLCSQVRLLFDVQS